MILNTQLYTRIVVHRQLVEPAVCLSDRYVVAKILSEIQGKISEP